MGPDARRAGLAAEGGFTLLEMLVALTVLGIVLATLLRLAGDALVQYQGRESRLLLALTAEAAFNAERLVPGAAASTSWPDGLTVRVERRELAAAANRLDGLGETLGALGQALDWLAVAAVDRAGREVVIEAAVPRRQSPAATGNDPLTGDPSSGGPPAGDPFDDRLEVLEP